MKKVGFSNMPYRFVVKIEELTGAVNGIFEFF